MRILILNVFFLLLHSLVIAKDSARQSKHYVDPKKAVEILQKTGHYSKNLVNYFENDAPFEDDATSNAGGDGGEDGLSHVSESSLERSPEKVFPNGEGGSNVIFTGCVLILIS